MKLSGDCDHPLITLVSRGSHFHDTHWGRDPDRKWAVTFADDPAQIHHRTGPSASAGRFCTGQNGGIQCGVAQYEQFEQLVRDVRGSLARDLLKGYLNCHSMSYRPRPIVYVFECRKGRHRSVAVCELLAHCMHTCGMSNVKVVHEHLHHHRNYNSRDHVHTSGSCGCPHRCRSNPNSETQWQWKLYLDEARRRARTAWSEYRLT